MHSAPGSRRTLKGNNLSIFRINKVFLFYYLHSTRTATANHSAYERLILRGRQACAILATYIPQTKKKVWFNQKASTSEQQSRELNANLKLRYIITNTWRSPDSPAASSHCPCDSTGTSLWDWGPPTKASTNKHDCANGVLHLVAFDRPPWMLAWS